MKDIVADEWLDIQNRYGNILLDEFIIMPNHLHGIIIVGATLAVALNEMGTLDNRVIPTIGDKNETENHDNRATYNSRVTARVTPTIGDIIGSFKSICLNRWIKYINENQLDIIGKFWQHNYYERIIRNKDELNQIRKYILDNPINWEIDEENPKYQFKNSML